VPMVLIDVMRAVLASGNIAPAQSDSHQVVATAAGTGDLSPNRPGAIPACKSRLT